MNKLTRQSLLRLVASTVSLQAIVQVFGVLGGILVIRLLPTHEYALYTLANTMLGTMTLLADGGIATGVMSQSGKVWQDKEKAGVVLVTGMYLRKKFALFSLLVATPALFYILCKHDASWLMSGLIVLSLIPVFFTSLSGSLLEIAPKLHQDVIPLQKIQLYASGSRLIMLGLMLFIYPFAAVAVICAGVSQIWSNWQLRRLSSRYANVSQLVDPVIRKEILSVVKGVMPGVIYLSVSGQLTVWLISIFGSTEAVAQVGALGRLAMILNLFSVLFNTLITPRFARLAVDPKLLRNRFFQIQAGLVFISSIIVIMVWLFPFHVLWILGKGYTELTVELVLAVAGGCAAFLAGSVYALNAVRNFIFPPAILYPVLIVVQVLFLMTFQVNTVFMAVVYTLIMQSIAYLCHLSYGIYSLAKVNYE